MNLREKLTFCDKFTFEPHVLAEVKKFLSPSKAVISGCVQKLLKGLDPLTQSIHKTFEDNARLILDVCGAGLRADFCFDKRLLQKPYRSLGQVRSGLFGLLVASELYKDYESSSAVASIFLRVFRLMERPPKWISTDDMRHHSYTLMLALATHWPETFRRKPPEAQDESRKASPFDILRQHGRMLSPNITKSIQLIIFL